ncbi:hypothetical protein [Magnetofaba australis]|nr:hypothetical protein [Magnetofaba australis]
MRSLAELRSIDLRSLFAPLPSAEAVNGAFARTAWLAALLGLIQGLLNPQWLNNVIDGQLIAGVTGCPTWLPEYIYEVNSFSLMNQSAAALIHLGLSDWTVNLIFSAGFAALAYASVATAALLLLRAPLLALLIPLVLTDLRLVGDHYYRIDFPLDRSIFGIVGMHGTLMILTLLIAGRTRLALFLVGLFPAVHASWAIALWLMTGVWFLLTKTNPFKRALLIPFISGVALFLVIGAIHLNFIKTEQPQMDPAQVEEAWQRFMRDDGRKNHNRLIGEQANVALESVQFFTSEILLLLLAGTLWRRRSGALLGGGARLLQAVFGLMAVAMAIRLALEFATEWVPRPLDVLLTSRWMNLDALLVHLLLIGWIIRLAVVERLRLALWALGLLTVIDLGSAFYKRRLPLLPCPDCPTFSERALANGSFVAVTTILLALLIAALWRRGGGVLAERDSWRGRMPEIFVGVMLLVWGGRALYHAVDLRQIVDPLYFSERHRHTPRHCDDWKRFYQERIVDGDGLLMVGPQAFENTHFNNSALYLSRRCIMGPPFGGHPYSLDSLLSSRKLNAQIACAPDPNITGAELVAALPACWANKSEAEWRALRREYGIGALLLNARWRVNLPESDRLCDLRLYELPK